MRLAEFEAQEAQDKVLNLLRNKGAAPVLEVCALTNLGIENAIGALLDLEEKKLIYFIPKKFDENRLTESIAVYRRNEMTMAKEIVIRLFVSILLLPAILIFWSLLLGAILNLLHIR